MASPNVAVANSRFTEVKVVSESKNEIGSSHIVIPPPRRRVPRTPSGHRLGGTILNGSPIPAQAVTSTCRMAIGGMTCAACSSTIETALRDTPGVISANVSVMTNMAEVTFDPAVIQPAALCTIVEDVGFEAQIDVEPISNKPVEPSEAHFTMSIATMTCVSCTSKVESSLRAIDGVWSVNVSLITDSAEITYNPRKVDEEQLLAAVRALGYDASPRRDPLAVAVHHTDSSNTTVYIDIAGMKDNHAAASVETALKSDTTVSDVSVSMGPPPIATIRYDASRAEPQRYVSAIASLGYTASVTDTVPSSAVVGTSIPTSSDSAAGSEPNVQREARNRLAWALVFSIPVFLLAMVFPYVAATRPILLHYIYGKLTVTGLLMTILATPVQFWVGRVFIIAALKGLRHGSFNMSVLVSLGSLAAYTYAMMAIVHCMQTSTTDSMDMTTMFSWGTMTSTMGGEYFFETATTLITFVLLGRYLESLARGRTGEAITALLNLQATTATRVSVDGNGRIIGEAEIAANDLHVDDVVKVLRGQKIPADGDIVYGTATVDTSMLSGEFMPVVKRVDDCVSGAMVVSGGGPLYIRVTQVGADSQVSQIVKKVQQAQASRAPIQAFADRIAGIFVPIVMILSLITFIVWFSVAGIVPAEWRLYQTNFVFAFLFSISVLVIACPCALGLATPTAVMVGTGLAASSGILIKGGEPLEMAGNINAIIFDKTGTLTVGRPTVSQMKILTTDITVNELCQLILAAESNSEHIIARALMEFAKQAIAATSPASSSSSRDSSAAAASPAPLVTPEEFESVIGRGLKCRVGHRRVTIGNRAWMIDEGIHVSSEAETIMVNMELQAQTALACGVDGRLVAVIGLAEMVKDESASLLAELRRQGMQVWMCTGDNQRTAITVGRQLGIEAKYIVAQALPQAKLDLVTRLQAEGFTVAMIGDGINDSAALAKADLGISVGGGTDVAVESASMVLVRNDLRDLLTAFDLSRATMRRIKWNYAFALVYNVITIPLAAGVFYPFLLWRLPPELAALCMALSSVSVVVSSLLLNGYRKPVVKAAGLRDYGYVSSVSVTEQDHALCCPCLACSRIRSQSPLAAAIGGATIEPLSHSSEATAIDTIPLLREHMTAAGDKKRSLSSSDDTRIMYVDGKTDLMNERLSLRGGASSNSNNSRSVASVVTSSNPSSSSSSMTTSASVAVE